LRRYWSHILGLPTIRRPLGATFVRYAYSEGRRQVLRQTEMSALGSNPTFTAPQHSQRRSRNLSPSNQPSETPHKVHEYAAPIIVDIGQIVRHPAELVSQPDADMVVHVPVDTQHKARVPRAGFLGE
jgi:hypothetical protein